MAPLSGFISEMSAFQPLKVFMPVISMISEISIFGGVTDAQWETILPKLERGTFKKGETIFAKGEEPTHIYILQSGKVELIISDGEVTVEKKVLGPGECFGQVSLMSMHHHTATAKAEEDCVVVGLSRHALIEMKKEDIALFALLMMNVARELARRLMLTDNLLLHYVHTHEDDEKDTANPPKDSFSDASGSL